MKETPQIAHHLETSFRSLSAPDFVQASEDLFGIKLLGRKTAYKEITMRPDKRLEYLLDKTQPFSKKIKRIVLEAPDRKFSSLASSASSFKFSKELKCSINDTLAKIGNKALREDFPWIRGVGLQSGGSVIFYKIYLGFTDEAMNNPDTIKEINKFLESRIKDIKQFKFASPARSERFNTSLDPMVIYTGSISSFSILLANAFKRLEPLGVFISFGLDIKQEFYAEGSPTYNASYHSLVSQGIIRSNISEETNLNPSDSGLEFCEEIFSRKLRKGRGAPKSRSEFVQTYKAEYEKKLDEAFKIFNDLRKLILDSKLH